MANRNKKNGFTAAEEEENEHQDTNDHPELFDLGEETAAPGDEDEEDEEEDDEDDQRFTGGLTPVGRTSPSYLHLLKMNNQTADKLV